MNKTELIEAIAAETQLSKAKASEAIDAFTTVVTRTLKSGEAVNLIGFGSFVTADRAERKGRNPSTGKEITIKAATTPKFRPGKALKDAVAK